MQGLMNSPVPKLKFFDPSTGTPLAGGLLFTYANGTTTKQTTYSAPGTPNTNPIVLDANGECVVILNSSELYTFTLAYPGDTDPPTNPIWSVNDIGSPGQGQWAPINSPAFTGTPTAPTPAQGDVSGDLATTAFVAAAIAAITGFAPINSPSFTGTPLAPTAAAGTNTTQIATTAFVAAAIAAMAALPTGGITVTPTSVQIGSILIQTGTGSAPATGNSNSNVAVTFAKPFSTCLAMLVTPTSVGPGSSSLFAIPAVTVSNTGATVYFNTNNGDFPFIGAINFNYIAIGTVAV